MRKQQRPRVLLQRPNFLHEDLRISVLRTRSHCQTPFFSSLLGPALACTSLWHVPSGFFIVDSSRHRQIRPATIGYDSSIVPMPLSYRNFQSGTFKADEPTGKELESDVYSSFFFQLLFIFP